MYNFIYKTTNIVNGKIYVGKHQTKVLEDGYLGSGTVLKKAIKKHGKHNFFREILEYCDPQTINDREIYWIDKLNSMDKEIGYNLYKGGTGFACGDLNPMRSNIDLIRKHSDRMRTSNPMFNPIIAKKVGNTQRGMLCGEKNPMYGVRITGTRNHMYGKQHTLEVKNHLRRIHGTPVNIGGISYQSMKQAAKYESVDRVTITNRCNSSKWPDYILLKRKQVK